MKHPQFDCVIVGGGLAGLTLSILLAQQKRSVMLIEKRGYPMHKVCGEYVSMESYQFLCRLGLPLQSMQLPIIKQLLLTADNRLSVTSTLEQGGFGISRYTLEHLLYHLAVSLGVQFSLNTIVNQVQYQVDTMKVISNQGEFYSKQVCATFGKHAFGNFYKSPHLSTNWVGVKYHIKYDFPNDLIALHNFKGGYCGISKIEDNKYCLCYLTKASELNKYSNQFSKFEQEVLGKNPYLKHIFEHAEFLFDKPLTVSNVTFSVKKAVHNHVFYLGDAAGTIAPLSGNGMSNAMRASNILAEELAQFYQGSITQSQLEHNYQTRWIHTFRQRIQAGRFLQYFFCKHMLTSWFIWIVKSSKPLQRFIIKQTHGMPF